MVTGAAVDVAFPAVSSVPKEGGEAVAVAAAGTVAVAEEDRMVAGVAAVEEELMAVAVAPSTGTPFEEQSSWDGMGDGVSVVIAMVWSYEWFAFTSL